MELAEIMPASMSLTVKHGRMARVFGSKFESATP
jgi:hypothetical protein